MRIRVYYYICHPCGFVVRLLLSLPLPYIITYYFCNARAPDERNGGGSFFTFGPSHVDLADPEVGRALTISAIVTQPKEFMVKYVPLKDPIPTIEYWVTSIPATQFSFLPIHSLNFSVSR